MCVCACDLFAKWFISWSGGGAGAAAAAAAAATSASEKSAAAAAAAAAAGEPVFLVISVEIPQSFHTVRRSLLRFRMAGVRLTPNAELKHIIVRYYLLWLWDKPWDEASPPTRNVFGCGKTC